MPDMEHLKRKLALSQFGDITGPSDSELDEIELEQASDPFYTPERIAENQAAYAHLVDPNFAAMRRARQAGASGGRGAVGAGSFELPAIDYEQGGRGGDMAAQADLSGNEEALLRSGEIASGEGAPSTAYDEESTGRGRRYGGVSMGSFVGGPEEGGARAASRFDTQAPRTFQEGLARRQGLLLLRLAGPSCNHPRCQKIRAKGVELLGTAIGQRGMSNEPGVASGESIPSVRKDVRVPPWRIKEEARGKDRPVMSHGTGTTGDTGDWEIMYGQETVSPKYEPANPKDPRLALLQKEQSHVVRQGQPTYLEPSDYLEHHHYPGEEFEPLPWEK